MRIIKPSYKILSDIDSESILKHIEKCGRICYKSEDKITEESARVFVKKIIGNKHESVLEHFSFTVVFINDRGVSHEEVRHRLSSFSQESTRYVNYGKEDKGGCINYIDIKPHFDNLIGGTVVNPDKVKIEVTPELIMEWLYIWTEACRDAEKHYLYLTKKGCPPQLARSVLNNSTKTEIAITSNLRQWRTIFKQRTSFAAHPQIREVMEPLLKELKQKLPIVFDDL